MTYIADDSLIARGLQVGVSIGDGGDSMLVIAGEKRTKRGVSA